MATNLTTDDIKKVDNRPEMTELESVDKALVFDETDKIIKKISKANLKETLGINANASNISDLDTNKADKSDTYTKTEVDNIASVLQDNIDEKANSADVYTKVDVDASQEAQDLVIAEVQKDILINTERLSSVNSQLAQTKLAGDTITNSDYGSVVLSGQALKAKADFELSGLTAENLVSGKDVAIGGTVVFASIVGHNYYDYLHKTILAGTGSNITITNDTGAIADIMAIDLTNTFTSEPSATDCQKIFTSYFDGLQSISGKGAIEFTDADTNELSKLFYSTEVLKSVLAIADKLKLENGVLSRVGNIKEYTLQASDVTALVVATNVTYVQFNRTVLLNNDLGADTAIETSNKIKIGGWTAYNGTSYDNIDNIGLFSVRISSSKITLITDKTTYATLAEAQADLAGTVIQYQLATPTTEVLAYVGGTLASPYGNANQLNETPNLVIAESTTISTPNITSLVELIHYDDGLETKLDVSLATIGTDTITHPDIIVGEMYSVIYKIDSNGLQGKLDVTSFNDDNLLISPDGTVWKVVKTIDNSGNITEIGVAL